MKFYPIRLLRPVLHAIIIAVSFWLAYLLRLRTDLIPDIQLRIPPINVGELQQFALISLVIFGLIAAVRGLYALTGSIANFTQKLFTVFMLWFVFTTGIAYFGQGFLWQIGISRIILLISSGFVLVGLGLTEWMMSIVSYFFVKRQKALIYSIGSEEDISDYQEFFPEYECDIATVLPEELEIYDLIVLVGSVEKSFIVEMIEKARRAAAQLAHIQDGVLLPNIRVHSQDMGGMHLWYYQSQVIGGWGRVVKRLFDLIMSIIGLIILSPILMIIGLLVYLQDRGPIFFWQKRVGKNGKDFWFVKFRSMKLEFCTGESDQNTQKALEFEKQLINSKRNARVGILPKIKDDPRVTKLGHFIRRLSLDELPSLWCVLVGDMSLIGPRPHLPREVAKYEERHRQLLTVKPGISGYAQIFGRDQLEFDREAKLDIYYVQNWSLWMDFYVMFATVGVIFKGK